MQQQDLGRVRTFLDQDGRIAALPVKRVARRTVLAYLAQQFPAGEEWTEKEVNAVIDRWHTFGDYFVLRRELVDEGFLQRTRDGARYWRVCEEDGGGPA